MSYPDELGLFPFERSYIERTHGGLSADGKGMEFAGTVGDVISEIEAISEDQQASPNLWTPARVLRGVIDFKIENPDAIEKDEVFDTVSDISALTIDLYQGKHPKDIVSRLKQKVLSIDGLVDAPADQNFDPKTLLATHPELSQKQAEVLAKTKGDSSLFMLVLAHGGVVAGVHTLLRYKDLTDDSDAEIYPARLSVSQAKMLKDEQPQLSALEAEKIAEISKDRRIIIFDEDISSGRTLRRATDYFSELTGQDLMFITNYGDASDATNLTHRLALKDRQLTA